MVTMIVNAAAWEVFFFKQKTAYEIACNEQTLLMPANYDDKNPAALRRLVAQGVQLRAFPKPVMDACYKAAFQTFDELAAKDEDFRKVYEAWRKFLEESNLWFRVA